MSVVNNIARKLADEKVTQIVTEMARDFGADTDWIRSWGPRFRLAMVGKREAPTYTADQIQKAFDNLMLEWRFKTPPKPADLTAAAREFMPLPKLQKEHTDPTPGRTYTPEERAANLAYMDRINAFIAEQNKDPEYVAALRDFGKGSPELRAVVERQKGEMRIFLQNSAP